MRKQLIRSVPAATLVAFAGFIYVAESSAQYGPPVTYPPTPSMTSPSPPPPSPAPSSAPRPASSPTSPTPPRSTSSAKNTVTVGDFFFHPKKLKVTKGGRITWKWVGMATHNVTFKQLHKHSRTQTSGSYSLSFPKKGSYQYFCTIHGFSGTIVVG